LRPAVDAWRTQERRPPPAARERAPADGAGNPKKTLRIISEISRDQGNGTIPRRGIYFGGAAHIRSAHHAGTKWGKKGQTPIVKAAGARRMRSLQKRPGKIRAFYRKPALKYAA
jgi:hypothetical protein